MVVQEPPASKRRQERFELPVVTGGALGDLAGASKLSQGQIVALLIDAAERWEWHPEPHERGRHHGPRRPTSFRLGPETIAQYRAVCRRTSLSRTQVLVALVARLWAAWNGPEDPDDGSGVGRLGRLARRIINASVNYAAVPARTADEAYRTSRPDRALPGQGDLFPPESTASESSGKGEKPEK